MSGVAFTPVPAVLAVEVLDALEDLLADAVDDLTAVLEDADGLGADEDADFDDAVLAGVVAAALAD